MSVVFGAIFFEIFEKSSSFSSPWKFSDFFPAPSCKTPKPYYNENGEMNEKNI